jgi:hypothetical protein
MQVDHEKPTHLQLTIWKGDCHAGGTLKCPHRWCDMSQGCSQGSKPKTGSKQTQKENIPKQRKYKYFTSLKL